MLFNKKRFISFLAMLVGVPVYAGPVKSSKPSNKASINIPLPFSKSTGEEIAGGVAVVLALTACWKIYNLLGGTKSFQQFLTEANAQATKAVKAQQAASKATQGKRFKDLTEEQKSSIIDQSYESYVVDNSAKLLGVSGDAFKAYVDGLEGATFVDKLTTAQSVVNTLSSDPRSAIPGAIGNEQPFKSALRYAIENGVTTTADAGPIANNFPKTVEINRATGVGPSGEIGSQVGRAVDNLNMGIQEGVSNMATGAQEAFNSLAQNMQKQAGLAVEGYQGQVVARSQAAQLQSEAAQIRAAQAAQIDNANVVKADNEVSSKPVTNADDLDLDILNE